MISDSAVLGGNESNGQGQVLVYQDTTSSQEARVPREFLDIRVPMFKKRRLSEKK